MKRGHKQQEELPRKRAGQLQDDIKDIINTTSGSELELEQRFLLKGNIVAARNSLFDFFQVNSWIKKTNYEGIFNAMLTIFVMFVFHKPLVSSPCLSEQP